VKIDGGVTDVPPAGGGAARLAERWLAPLLSLRGVVAFWLLYAASHAALRFLASKNLSGDDARESELVQSLALGYQIRQPPLYEWLLWSIQQVIGPGIASHLVLRYLLIAGIGIVTFTATRALTGEQRWSAVASLSLVLTYPVGWTFHEWATQTLLLSIACIVSLHATVAFIRQPSLWTAILLGLAIGLGLMSKFSYLLLLGGLLVAVASLPETRGRLADRRLLLACAVALACVVPYVYWLIQIRGDLIEMASEQLVRSSRSHPVRALIGLARLSWSLPAFLMPWLAVVALLAWPAFRRSPPAPPADVGEQIALRAMVVAAILAAIGIAIVGATNIAERYMHPILMTAPVYVFARIARVAPETRRLNWLARAAAVGAAIILVGRLASFIETDLTRRQFSIPYDGLAVALTERGITGGTLIAPKVREAGNMRAHIPELRVFGRDSFRVERPPRRPSDAQSCVLLWRDGEIDLARQVAPRSVDTAERIEVVMNSLLGVRHDVWFVAKLDPGTRDCF
jgi:4-amino-4-deoxy-L-arabinose transferase-like glycosyltransferase